MGNIKAPGMSGGGGVGERWRLGSLWGFAVTTGDERFGMSTSGRNLSLSFEVDGFGDEDFDFPLPHETRSSF